MKNKIQLNKDFSIDIPKLIEGGAVILANSGGGKSYAIRKVAEEAVSEVQVILIDPEGEFASLREKYDFILAGKNADVPVEVRSASLLAIKLLELGKSAVIDLYELHPSERQRYVKLFCDAMINCPKELYHPVLIILDEAHEYVPEGKPSEATWAVEALASKGRKRGFRLIPASQRISKLSKNVSAECNNKLIGRASQDIDMKRAGDELGFNKEKLVQLRQLKPGEFFAFGPAISDEVIKIKIGEVKTAHAKVGYKNTNKIPLPSHRIAAVLAELKDLPKEAEKEAKTIAEFKAQIRDLKTKLTQIPKKEILVADPSLISKEVARAVLENDKKWKKQWLAEGERINKEMKVLGNTISKVKSVFNLLPETLPLFHTPEIIENMSPVEKLYNGYGKSPADTERPVLNKPYQAEVNKFPETTGEKEIIVKAGAKKMLNWLAGVFPDSLSKNRIATLSGFSVGGGTFDTYVSVLKRVGWITIDGDDLRATEQGHSVASPEEMPTGEELLSLWKTKFKAGAGKMLEILYHNSHKEITNDELAEMSGFEVKGGTYGTYLSTLRRNGLVEVRGNAVQISKEFFN